MSYNYTVRFESNSVWSEGDIHRLKLAFEEVGDDYTSWGFTAVKMPRPDEYEEG